MKDRVVPEIEREVEREFGRPFPRCWSLCATCDGEGKHSQHLGDFTSSEFDEAFDADEQAAYFTGAYDRRCDDCHGTGKVWSVNETAVDARIARGDTTMAAMWDALTEANQAAAYCAAESRAELRAMGWR